MSWLRLDDGCDTDPVLLNVCRNESEVDKVFGMMCRVKLWCARHLTDGFLPELVLRQRVRSRRWREMLTGPPGGGTALIHPRGAVCECLKDRLWPDTAADYAVHDYLRTNPSREESDVARAKAAELKDRELRAQVRKRDADRCRYCDITVRWADRRSTVGGVLDHVDPQVANGVANLVVACRGCNARKGARTPAAAGMVLLGEPDPVPRARRTDPITESSTDATTDPITDATTGGSTSAPVRDGTGRANDARPAGQIGPPGNRRHPVTPNPFLRSAITGPDPDDHAGLPPPADLAPDLADDPDWGEP